MALLIVRFWRAKVSTTIAILAVAAGAASAQSANPLVTKSVLPSPGCGGVAYFAIADFDLSGHQDFVSTQTNPAPALRLSQDPIVSPAARSSRGYS